MALFELVRRAFPALAVPVLFLGCMSGNPAAPAPAQAADTTSPEEVLAELSAEADAGLETPDIPAADKPLFAADSRLNMVLAFPRDSLQRAAPRSKEPFPATLTVATAGGAETIPLEVSPRGTRRRDPNTCRFPPLLFNFAKEDVPGTLFAGQNKLKLVTHCQERSDFQQYYILEYLVYRAYNLVTPLSFRVRLAEITYHDTDGHYSDLVRYGFLIEDVDDVAERNGLTELEMPVVPAARLDPKFSALFSVFQYMTGNLDWAFLRGPPGEDCCHNAKLLGLSEEGGSIIPVPYDFDYTGIVNAPYAIPPAQIRGIVSVRTRRYWGLCLHNSMVPDAVATFRQLEVPILDLFRTQPELNERTRDDALDYLGRFFSAIADPERVQDDIIDDCRS